MKPVCVDCKKFYRCKKTGIKFEEGMPLDSSGETWGPYKLWAGDLWECPECRSQIVVGISNAPISEHYKPDYKLAVEAYKPAFRVDDC